MGQIISGYASYRGGYAADRDKYAADNGEYVENCTRYTADKDRRGGGGVVMCPRGVDRYTADKGQKGGRERYIWPTGVDRYTVQTKGGEWTRTEQQTKVYVQKASGYAVDNMWIGRIERCIRYVLICTRQWKMRGKQGWTCSRQKRICRTTEWKSMRKGRVCRIRGWVCSGKYVADNDEHAKKCEGMQETGRCNQSHRKPSMALGASFGCLGEMI